MPSLAEISPTPTRPAIPLVVVVTIVAFFVEQAAPEEAIAWFALWPFDAGFAPWQLLTYAFLHAGLSHLAFNMLGLWIFGRALEQALGSRRTLLLYFASVLSAAGMQILVTSRMAVAEPTLGASGGVFGVLLAYAMLFPRRIIVLLIPPIPLPAWLFVTLYALLELTLGVTGAQGDVAHFAHLGGMVGGFLLMRHWLARAKAP